jgi:hypothetical protein
VENKTKLEKRKGGKKRDKIKIRRRGEVIEDNDKTRMLFLYHLHASASVWFRQSTKVTSS